MLLVNTTPNPVQVTLIDPEGNLDYMHLMGRGRAEVPVGFTVDRAWASLNLAIKCIESK